MEKQEPKPKNGRDFLETYWQGIDAKSSKPVILTIDQLVTILDNYGKRITDTQPSPIMMSEEDMKARIRKVYVAGGDGDYELGRIVGFDIGFREAYPIVPESHSVPISVEKFAKELHDKYEQFSKKDGWETQKSCKVEFKDLPEKNKSVMLKIAKWALSLQGGWSNKKPDKPGIWLRSNPALQKDVTKQSVFLVNGVLRTNHPQNEGSQEIDVKDMPDRFSWFYVPTPPNQK